MKEDEDEDGESEARRKLTQEEKIEELRDEEMEGGSRSRM